MTPTQLRAFAAVVRLGSVKRAAADLDVTEAAVSLHVGQLRKELGDKLFVRTASGLAFTPGGLRLASRAAEMLSLQDRTIIEVRQAGGGRRLLRVATSALFAEHAAPGLIELFADAGQRPGRRAQQPQPGPLRVAAADPDRGRGDRTAARSQPGPVDRQHALPELPGRGRGQPGPPDHSGPAGRRRAAGADVAARPVGGRRRRGHPGHAAPHQRARGAPADLPEPRCRARGGQAGQGAGAGGVVRGLAGPGQRRPQAGPGAGRCRPRGRGAS